MVKEYGALIKQADSITIGVCGLRWLGKLQEINDRLRVMAGDVNPNSIPQVAHYIYDVLKLRQIEDRSVSNRTLSLLAEQHEYPRLLLDYRRLRGKYGTWNTLHRYIVEELRADDVKTRRQA